MAAAAVLIDLGRVYISGVGGAGSIIISRYRTSDRLVAKLCLCTAVSSVVEGRSD